MLWFCRSKNINQHADVVDIKFFVNFFAAKNWLTVKLSMSNSIKFKTTFVREHTTYKTLTERVNTFVVILPNENKIKFTAQSIHCGTLRAEPLLFPFALIFITRSICTVRKGSACRVPLWWSSFPSSLRNFFTVTNSKDCPTIDEEKLS